MIKAIEVIKGAGAAIIASADLSRLMDENSLTPRLVLGRMAVEGMNAEDRRLVVSVYLADGGYNLGYVQERELPIEISVLMWSTEGDVDGVVELHTSPAVVLDAMHYIAEALRGSDFGADVLGAACTLNTENWPLVVGKISATVTWPVALNSEASYDV